MFKPIEQAQLERFNSTDSSEFLKLYESALDESILEGESKIPSRTFAPSQIKCKRVSWFRLRGVQPEKEVTVDRVLNFTTVVGTACHQNIQDILSKKLDSNWIDVETYLKFKNPEYEYTCSKTGFETSVSIVNPPIKFAPDGIIFWKGEHWLLEIKTSEYSSFDRLTAPKSNHLDQVKCYATLLGIHKVLMIYQDRMYGNLKCFEVTITDEDMQSIWDMFEDVQNCVKMNIAPAKPSDTKYCTPSYCRYCNVCKEW